MIFLYLCSCKVVMCLVLLTFLRSSFAQPSVSNVGAEVNNSECTELGRWRQLWKEASVTDKL